MNIVRLTFRFDIYPGNLIRYGSDLKPHLVKRPF